MTDPNADLEPDRKAVEELCHVIGEHLSVWESRPFTSAEVQSFLYKHSAISAYRTLERDGREEHGRELRHFNPEERPAEAEAVYERVWNIALAYPAYTLWMDDSVEWVLRDR